MILYYQLAVADCPPDFLIGKRLNVAKDTLMFDAEYSKYLDAESLSKAVPFEQKTEEDFLNFINIVGGDWAPMPTAEEIEQERQSIIASHKSRINQAVASSRLKYSVNLPHQDQAYITKIAAMNKWLGLGNAPDVINGLAEKYGISEGLVKTEVTKKWANWEAYLLQTEYLRDIGIAAANNEDEAAIEDIISQLNALELAE